MDTRETVARAIAGVFWSKRQDVDKRWELWLPEADAAISAISVVPEQEDMVWKIAQLAATLHSGLSAGGNEVSTADVVKAAHAILVESRRQVAASPTAEGGGDGR